MNKCPEGTLAQSSPPSQLRYTCPTSTTMRMRQDSFHHAPCVSGLREELQSHVFRLSGLPRYSWYSLTKSTMRTRFHISPNEEQVSRKRVVISDCILLRSPADDPSRTDFSNAWAYSYVCDSQSSIMVELLAFGHERVLASLHPVSRESIAPRIC